MEPVDQLIPGKILPQAIDLEEAVLGAIIVDGTSMNVVCDFLKATDFYLKSHQLIYEALINLREKGLPIDLLTTHDECNRIGKLDEIGGVNYLMTLSNRVTSSANVEYHAKLIQDKAIHRELIKSASDAIREAFLGEKMATELIGELKYNLDHINRAISKPKSLSDDFKDLLDSGNEKELKTGFIKIDRTSKGLPGVTVIGAAPGEGKSVLGLNIARNVALSGIPVVIFSLEMKKRQILRRLLSDELSTTVSDIKSGRYDKTKALRSYIPSLPLFIYDDVFDARTMVSVMRGHFRGLNEGLAIIDYIQISTLIGESSNGKNKEALFSEISRELKRATMQMNIPIIVLAQVNRDKTRKYYQLGDIKDCSAIEANADNVLFVYRPICHSQKTYNLNGDDVDMGVNDAIITIAKCRDGQTGDIRMKFIGEYLRFEDYNESGTDYVRPMPELENQIIGVKGDLNNIPF